MAMGPCMDQAVDRIAISGSILAHILQDFNSSRGDCDGVLFGHLRKTVSPKFEDDDEHSGMHEELTAIITGFLCSGRVFSFYDACGRIIPAKLTRFLSNRGSRGGDPLIGWFSGRHSTPMRPSLRETAVTKCLRLSGLFNSRDASATPAGADDMYERTTLLRNDPSNPAHMLGSPLHMARSDSKMADSPSRMGECSLQPQVNQSTPEKLHPFGGKAAPIDLDSPTSDIGIDRPPKLSIGQQGGSQGSSCLGTLSYFEKSLGVSPSSPCIFMLLTESGAGQAVHAHEYRVYQYHFSSQVFEPRTLKIVNIGPAFRVQYDSFSPVTSFPFFLSSTEEEGESNSSSTALNAKRREVHQGSRRTLTSPSKEQALLDVFSEGYNVERLASLANPDGLRQVPELEDLYSRMLLKLEILAKHVCETSSALITQEKANKQLRLSAAGLE
ncbi:hypothetical protein L7F22_035152 [Adiantum nelumboides]|nr:hypothetical protein [Adiantum nelumboides]